MTEATLKPTAMASKRLKGSKLLFINILLGYLFKSLFVHLKYQADTELLLTAHWYIVSAVLCLQSYLKNNQIIDLYTQMPKPDTAAVLRLA